MLEQQCVTINKKNHNHTTIIEKDLYDFSSYVRLYNGIGKKRQKGYLDHDKEALSLKRKKREGPHLTFTGSSVPNWSKKHIVCSSLIISPCLFSDNAQLNPIYIHSL